MKNAGNEVGATHSGKSGALFRRSRYWIIFSTAAIGVAATLFFITGETPVAGHSADNGTAVIQGMDESLPASSSDPADHKPDVLTSAAGERRSKSLATSPSKYSQASNGKGMSVVTSAPHGDADSGETNTGVRGEGKGAKRAKHEDLVMPEWKKIIYPDGSAVDVVGRNGRGGTNGIPDYLELYPAFEAGFIEEVISNGVATDMSALLVERDVADEVLYNGAVSAAHDLGNAYYLLSSAANGNLRLYIGVERLHSDLPTFIEFELNQDRIHVGSGIPWWNIQGSRVEGDLLIRFNLIAGTLSSVELAEWREDRYFIFESDTRGLGHGCRDRFSYLYCIGRPPIDRSHQFIEVWDEDFVPVEATLADSFVELGLDLGRLLRPGIEFSGLYIRTPEDVVLTSFRGIGSWAAGGIGSR